MKLLVYPNQHEASQAACERLADWLPAARTLVAAAGNSPLELYRLVAGRKVPLPSLHVFALDEYVGVPSQEPRNCANLLRRVIAEEWGIPAERFHAVSSRPEDAAESIRAHEAKLDALGGADVVVLGLGRNGHLGFNEPGSPPESIGRVLDLEPTSVEANRLWFAGAYAPTQGVTLGLRTLLVARRVLLVAFGAAKADAVFHMTSSPRLECPASWLSTCDDVEVYLDAEAAARLPEGRR